MDAETPLEVSTDSDVLVIKPHRTRRDTKKVKEVLEWVNDHYGSTFKRLAE